MRRYISLACVALVVIMCMVSPVSAAEYNNNSWFNVLDYTFANGSTTNSHLVSDGTKIYFPLPVGSTIYCVDILVYSPSGVSGVSVSRSADDTLVYNLDVISLGNNYYRLLGNLEGYYFRDIYLTFDMLGTGNVTFNQFHFLSVNAEHFETTAYGTGYYGENGEINVIADKSVASVPRYQNIFYDGDINLSSFGLFVEFPQWRKFDYIDLQLYLDVNEVTSISAHLNETVIPCYISPWDNSTISGAYYISVRLDLRGLDRSISDDIQLICNGGLNWEQVNQIALLNVDGYILSDDSNPLLYYFTMLKNWLESLTLSFSSDIFSLGSSVHDSISRLDTWIQNQTDIIELGFSNLMSEIQGFSLMVESGFGNVVSWISALTDALEVWLSRMETNIVSAIRGDTAPGDSFQQEVDQKDQQLNDMAAVMDSVNKPQIDSVNVSADTYVDQTVLAASMSGLNAVISMPVFLDVIMMALIMATAGYVLFGKR